MGPILDALAQGLFMIFILGVLLLVAWVVDELDVGGRVLRALDRYDRRFEVLTDDVVQPDDEERAA